MEEWGDRKKRNREENRTKEKKTREKGRKDGNKVKKRENILFFLVAIGIGTIMIL